MKAFKNIGMLATCRDEGNQSDLHAIHDAAIAWNDEGITWLGPEREFPDNMPIDREWDAGGGLVIPGLVDCHSHLAFGGWRPDEFEQRCLGRSYEEIAKAGGGILSTVEETRKAGREELLDKSTGLIDEIARLGVTTLECKSGYGLDTESEIKTLQVYQDLRRRTSLRLKSTFLGAHSFPPEYREDREAYVRLVIEQMLPRVAEQELAGFCDVFADHVAFSPEQARRVLEAGKQHGMQPKIHADQLSASGGAELAAELGAVSADHLENISSQGIEALARTGTVAVSLPFATHYLRKQPLPARELIEAGAQVAVATDFNPGSAPSYHLPLVMTMACTMQSMTPAEALKGATLYAAKALDMEDRIGSLEIGKAADLVLIDAENVNSWLYHFRPNACRMSFVDGEVIIWQ